MYAKRLAGNLTGLEINNLRHEIPELRTKMQKEVIENPSQEVSLEDGKLINSDTKVGDYVYDPLPPIDFGRVAAQTAKQVGENADAVIVGSALVSIVEELSSDKDKMVTKVGNLAKEISSAIT